MKFGLFMSVMMHLVVIIVVAFNVPSFLLPKPEVKAIQVKIVQAKNVKKTTKKEKPKAVNTQQSEAPKAPPKKKEKPKPKPKPKKKAPTVVKKESKKKVQTKKEVKKPEPPKPQPKKEQPKPKPVENKKPPKLDKSKDKKNIVKDKEAPKTTPTPDDFLKALSFVEDLKAEQSAQFEGEDTEKTTLNLAEQADIARIKKHIEQNWYRTPGTHGKEFAQIRLKVNRDGTLSSMNVITYEGSTSFIGSLKRAIRRSAPLPIPADKYDTFREIDLYWDNS